MKDISPETIPIRLDYYLEFAETFAKLIDALLPQKDSPVLIDMCPGWSPKVGLALLKTRFQGIYLPLDRSKNCLSTLETLLNPFEKRYKVSPFCADIFQTAPFPQSDIVVLNHIIDDLLVFSFLEMEQTSRSNPFDDITELQDIWQKILKQDHAFFETLRRKISLSVSRLTVAGGIVAGLQYQGYQEKLYLPDETHTICKKLLQDVFETLKTDFGFHEHSHSAAELLRDASYTYFDPTACLLLRKSFR